MNNCCNAEAQRRENAVRKSIFFLRLCVLCVLRVKIYLMKTLNVDLDLVKKYNVAGPRYTSYPPATKFTDAVTWEQLSAKIEDNNRTPRDLSVYFHIPFCETLCWFCGCTTVITLNHDKGMAYIEALGREVARHGADAEQGSQGRATPFRRRLADVFAAGRNPPPRRNHPQAFHVFAGHRSERGGGSAPAHARAHGRAARNRFQPRLDGRAGFQSESAGGDSPHPAARDDAAGDGLDARTRLQLDQSRFDLRPAAPDAGDRSTKRSTPFWK